MEKLQEDNKLCVMGVVKILILIMPLLAKMEG
jgi:hypothetical protein